MDNLKIALVQTSIYWENCVANLAMLEEKIFNISEPIDLIVLPEMFNSGFSMNAQHIAEPSNGHTTKWMKQMATQTKAAICGSIAIKENGKFYNRFLFVCPSGEVYFYDKIHTFTFAGENEIYQNGNNNTVVNYKKWKINLQICYDLRFPESARNQVVNDEYLYDLCIYVANWPQSRIAAWTHLLEARAIENSSFIIGVNRTGTDGRHLIYNGQSAVCFPLPENNISCSDPENIFIYELNRSLLDEYRMKYPFLKDLNF